MTHPWCPTNAQKDTPDYNLNVTALWIIFGVSIVVSIWYGFASYEAHHQRLESRKNVEGAADRQFLRANLLSGALVSLVAISLLYTTFPQPIEATLSVVLALSQASALGWLDFPPDALFWDVFSMKIPDVFALCLTLWITWNAKEQYFDQQGGRDAKYPPFVYRDPWIPFAVLSAVNEITMMIVYAIWLVERRARNDRRFTIQPHFQSYVLAGCLIFSASSTAGAAVGFTFARRGCYPFTLALALAPCAVLSGAIYSWFQTHRRLQDFDMMYPLRRTL